MTDDLRYPGQVSHKQKIRSTFMKKEKMEHSNVPGTGSQEYS